MKRAAFCLILAVLADCAPHSANLNDLGIFFQKPEFIPSRGVGADGWAEARRRQLLKSYLRKNGLNYTEQQLPETGGKYRDTRLIVAGHSGRDTLRVSLSLKPEKDGMPDAQFAGRQQACDRLLLTFLRLLPAEREKWQAIEFSPTESCIDLTGQRTLPD